MYDIQWKSCGVMLCMSPEDAKRTTQNKVQVYRWMGQANAVMDYYETRDQSLLPKAATSQY